MFIESFYLYKGTAAYAAPHVATLRLISIQYVRLFLSPEVRGFFFGLP